MKLLIVEDEDKLAKLLERGFSEEGFIVDVLCDGKKAESRVLAQPDMYDIVILDRMLPGITGTEVLRGWREKGVHMPVIMLTARDTKEDIVEGLHAGADDYLIKPFSFDELLARVHALMRRPAVCTQSIVEAGPLELSIRTKEVRLRGEIVALTVKEFEILELLIQKKGEIVSREAILNHCWEYNFNPFSNVIDVHIKNLRKKINQHEELLHTIRGAGYQLAK